jgi:hypothetical protein
VIWRVPECLELIEFVGDHHCSPATDLAVIPLDGIVESLLDVANELLRTCDLGLLPINEEYLQVPLVINHVDQR